MSLIMSSKALTANDLNDRFTVPATWLAENWPDIGNGYRERMRVVHQVTLSMERWYEFELSTRPENNMKPVFQFRGWHQFVRDNDLHKNDVVRFGKKEGQQHYTIMVERKHM